MARGGTLNLIGAICTQGGAFVVTLLLALTLGRKPVGLYAEAYAFFSLCGIIALTGMSAGVTRYVAVHRVDRDMASVRGTIRLALGITTSISVPIAVVLFAIAPTLTHAVFHQTALTGPLRYVAVSLPLFTFSETSLSATQGYRTMKPYALIILIGEPVIQVVLTACLLEAGMGLRGAMVGFFASYAMAALLGGAVLRRMVGRQTEKPRYNVRELFSFSTVNWIATLSSVGLIYADTLLLGAMRTSGEVGTYNVATRLVTAASFVMLPINMAFAPRIADLYKRGATANLEVTYHTVTSWIIRLSLPAFVVLVCFSRDILRLFGHSFTTAAEVTVIFAIGKLVDAGTGPCGLMLNMIGRPKFQMFNNIGALLLNVVLNLWWIPRFGIVGSAAAWTVALLVVNASRVLQVWALLGMLPLDSSAFKGLLAGAAALLSGLAIDILHPPAELIVGVACVVFVYMGLILVQRLSSQDREVLSALLPRNLKIRSSP